MQNQISAQAWCVECKLSLCLKCVNGHSKRHTGEKPRHLIVNLEDWAICDDHKTPCCLICMDCEKETCAACVVDENNVCSNHRTKLIPNCIEGESFHDSEPKIINFFQTKTADISLIT